MEVFLHENERERESGDGSTARGWVRRKIHVTRMTKKVILPDGGPVAGENGAATESH